jgi:hypothetical protein
VTFWPDGRTAAPEPTTRARFALIVEALPDSPPGVVRLRAWLKRGLRAFRLKCVDAREIAGDGAPHQEAPPAAQEGTTP